MPPGKPAQIGVKIGHVFLGKYRVDAILGSGGMGVVAQCTHLALNERVAIKMLRQDVLQDHDAVERFTREAQAAAKLKSEHVAHVSDVGRFEDGVPYMVMEFLDGLDLDQLVDQRGTIPVPWTVDLMLQSAEALAEAHSIGIVHRDVKPSNLFVTWRPDGTALVKVLDFGISKSAAGADMQLTQTQSLLGTPAYMSPEQMRSARLVDARTDIWSLGTVMYELLEGRKPFEAESFSEMCVKVAVDAPMPMNNTPLGLQAVVLRCLAKQPEQRYPSMAEFARDLIPFAQDQHQAALLVERMFRMLRRVMGDAPSANTWEGLTTNTGARVQPYRGSDVSQPVSTPWAAGSQPAAPIYQQQVAPTGPHAASFQVPSEPVDGGPTLRTQKKKSLLPWLGLVAIAAIIGITIGVIASQEDEPRKPVTSVPDPVVQPTKIETPEVKVVTPDVKPADVKDPPKVEDAPPKDQKDQKVEDAPKVTPPPKKTVTTPPLPPKKEIKKDPPKVETAPTPPPPPPKKTNPFDSRVGK